MYWATQNAQFRVLGKDFGIWSEKGKKLKKEDENGAIFWILPSRNLAWWWERKRARMGRYRPNASLLIYNLSTNPNYTVSYCTNNAYTVVGNSLSYIHVHARYKMTDTHNSRSVNYEVWLLMICACLWACSTYMSEQFGEFPLCSLREHIWLLYIQSINSCLL
jgi:hypothetical protein